MPSGQLCKENSVPSPRRAIGASVAGKPARLGHIEVTRVGLKISTALTFDTWERAGFRFARIADTTAWCLADWLIYGQNEFSDRYQRAIEAAGLDYQTLRNYAWVARRFEVSRRRASLSFQHHAEVASLPRVEQDHLLDQAEARGWSRNELRRQVRQSRSNGSAATRTPAFGAMTVDAQRVKLWRQAAEQSSCAFEEWVLNSLDAAATRALTLD